MYEIGQETVPTGETDREVFLSLRLAEPSERVRVTLDDCMLSIEGKRNATVDMRLHAIATMKHHSSNLVPAWLIFLGLALVWIGYRVMVPPLYRLMFVASGSALVLARVLTKKPTLTIQTTSGDTHVLFGNERALNRLSFMYHLLVNNNSMADVRAKLAAIETERDRGWREPDPAPVVPGPLHVPQVVEHFLHASGEEATPSEIVESIPDWTPTHEPEVDAPPAVVGFIPSFQPVVSHQQPQNYPPDHRPAPIPHPVLIPQGAPPMYQTAFGDGQGFFPSFMNRDSAHIPGIHLEEEPEEQPEELHLDPELIEAIDGIIEQELEPPAAPSEPRPVQPQTTLKPKVRPSIEESPFRPRRTQSLHRKERRGFNMFARVRETSSGLLGRATQAGRPRPYATSETSGALREQAAADSPPGTQRVMNSLSQEEGGVMTPQEVARLGEREALLLAKANELSQSEEGRLETMSFNDMRSSSGAEDTLDLPRLDED